MDKVSQLTVNKDFGGINSAVNEGHKLLLKYSENILACSRYCTAPVKPQKGAKKAAASK